MFTQLANLNYWEILLGLVVYAVVGALVYSPLMFSKPWAENKGLTEEDTKNPAKGFGLSMLGALVMSFVTVQVSHWSEVDTTGGGFRVGIALALLVSAALFINMCFGSESGFNRRMKVWLIDSLNYFLFLGILGALTGYIV